MLHVYILPTTRLNTTLSFLAGIYSRRSNRDFIIRDTRILLSQQVYSLFNVGLVDKKADDVIDTPVPQNVSPLSIIIPKRYPDRVCMYTIYSIYCTWRIKLYCHTRVRNLDEVLCVIARESSEYRYVFAKLIHTPPAGVLLRGLDNYFQLSEAQILAKRRVSRDIRHCRHFLAPLG